MIPYHGTPIGGGVEPAQCLTGRHALVSFERTDNMDQVAAVCQSFILDSGAFTAWRQGREFDIGGYLKWVQHWHSHPGFDWALAPDVIDGGEVENDALLQLVSHQRHHWTPVWHLDESLERLQRLCQEWPRVALGSAGAYATIGTSGWWNRMSEALGAITNREGRPYTKLHGLRMLDPDITSRVPFASADSANVGTNCAGKRWSGPYVPRSVRVRALVLMDRAEVQGADHWCRSAGHTPALALEDDDEEPTTADLIRGWDHP